jgi:DNA-binding transcriptional ArsR family regulator
LNKVAVFRALGEETRLQLVERLIAEPKLQLHVLTEGLGLTRQGGRRHVQVLADANLVKLRPEGRDVWVELDVTILRQAKLFIELLEIQWDQRLQTLKQSIEAEE